MIDTTDIEQEYLDTPTLAKLVGVETHTVVADIKQGLLPAEKRPDRRGVRWGGCWFIHVNDAHKYIDMRKRGVLRGSISAREFGKRTGQDHRDILDAIHNGLLPASKDEYRKRATWHISEEDALAYSQRMGWKYDANGIDRLHNQTHASISLTTGSPDLCGSCGTKQGNIVGDVNVTTGKKYGYLCMRCYKLVRDFGGDPKRMRKVLEYVEKTRSIRVAHKKMPTTLEP